jgi:hypothetical protein
LRPGQFTPRLHESLVRLGTWLPFAQAAEALTFFTGVTVSAATVRRLTEGAGAAYEAVQTAAVETIERQLPPAPPGPRVQLLSVDGAMVPLQHGGWAEVKTLAIGTVSVPVQKRGEWVVHTAALSYFSRLTDAETFGHLALVETHRRGTETAKTVCAVSDGAEWIQGFVDLHRPDAVRILDFPHALGYVAQAGQAVYGEGTARFTQWFATQRRTLQYGNPEEVLGALQRLVAAAKRRRAVTASTTIQASLSYLAKRRGMLDYAWYQERGYPIGSGSVESANKLVVERRLKGTGMHWARAHVNPMVALRTMACSDRWQEAWPQLTQHVRHRSWQGRVHRQTVRRQSKAPIPLTTLPPHQPVTRPVVKGSLSALRRTPSSERLPPQTPKQPYRPPPDHPWRRFRFGRARSQPPVAACVADLIPSPSGRESGGGCQGEGAKSKPWQDSATL